MPSPKSGSQRHKEIKKRWGRLAPERSLSFHGGEGRVSTEGMLLPRPRTVPELIRRVGGGGGEAVPPPLKKKLTKILVKVTVLRSIGPLNVVVPLESTVEDLIAAVVKLYVKECQRPVLESLEPFDYGLHYSQFSLESLDRNEKLTDLGSRNFFLCPKKVVEGGGSTVEGGGAAAASTSTCSKEAQKGTKKGLTWLKFLDFSS